jgi:predicted secreted Zn-dependent protease
MPITETKKGWKISNTPGTSKSKKKAKQRLRAIKWRQGKRRNKRRRDQ